MEENKDEVVNQTKKFTYEQLESIAGNLSNQVQQLSARLQEANMFNMFKRLDYLFKVLEVADNISATAFKPNFVENCAQEIEELMTPATSETKPTEEK